MKRTNNTKMTQYEQKCAETECETILTENSYIMYYTSPEDEELHVCNDCYHEYGYVLDDINPDNKEDDEEKEFYKQLKKIKQEPYYTGCVFETANIQEKLYKNDCNYNCWLSIGLSNGWIEEKEVAKCPDSYSKHNKCPIEMCYDCDESREEEDAEYNVRCENGEAKCEECGKWGQSLDMKYDDDTGFHICCE
tara:strand:- start:348 stop:926 length:579 start_codon:yes stop_codon:yes gene_type:complete